MKNNSTAKRGRLYFTLVEVLVLSIFIQCLCGISALAATKDDFTGFSPFLVDTTFSSGKLVPNQMFSAKVVASSNVKDVPYEGKEDVLAIVALYDPSNAMVNVSYISKGIPYKGSETLTAGFKLPQDVKGYCVRSFVWDGTSLSDTNMIPLSEVNELKDGTELTPVPTPSRTPSPSPTMTPKASPTSSPTIIPTPTVTLEYTTYIPDDSQVSLYVYLDEGDQYEADVLFSNLPSGVYDVKKVGSVTEENITLPDGSKSTRFTGKGEIKSAVCPAEAPHPVQGRDLSYFIDVTKPGTYEFTFVSEGFNKTFTFQVNFPWLTPTPSKSAPTPTPTVPTEPPVVNSKDLKATTITATAEQPIVSGKNLIFCPTFQMAWDGVKEILKGDVLLSGNPPLAGLLNKGFPMQNSLSEDSYLSMAGYGQETVDKINQALEEKFKGAAPKLNEQISDDTIISYAYLSKNSMFSKAFFPSTMWFQSQKVKSFGIQAYEIQDQDIRTKLMKQLQIFDYRSKDDFIVKLLPDNGQDEIILAKTAPGGTLHETYQSVMNRISQSQPEIMKSYDSLVIPVLDFNIEHNYTELINQPVLNPGFESYFIQKAYQKTRFRLDEKGAILTSTATIIMPTSINFDEKEMVFNGSFMLCMKQKDAVNPYLIVWVDNPEFMEKLN